MDDPTNLQWLIERTQIIEVIVGAANAFDEKNWQKLRGYLNDKLEVDYSDFRGEPPQRVTAEHYLKQRIEGLAGLKTLHISTNHEVTIAGDAAQCRSAYRIYRRDPARLPGNDRLDTAGSYLHQLIRVDGSWRICGIQQTVVAISGDSQVHGAFRRSAP